MKAKNFLIVFAVILIAMSFFACDIFTTSKIGKDTKPYPKTVTVDYAQVLPLPNPFLSTALRPLVWKIGENTQSVFMTYVSDYNFTATASIMTESLVEIWVNDPEMYNGFTGEVAEDIEIDGQKLNASSLYGHAKFIYHNDGTITYPKT